MSNFEGKELDTCCPPICHSNSLIVLYCHFYNIIWWLTPWSRVLEKLNGSQVVKFPAFSGTWRFITAFTSVRHLSLYWGRSTQSMPIHPTSWKSILILSLRRQRSMKQARGCVFYCVTFSLLDPNIFCITLFPCTVSLCLEVHVTCHISHSYTPGNI